MSAESMSQRTSAGGGGGTESWGAREDGSAHSSTPSSLKRALMMTGFLNEVRQELQARGITTVVLDTEPDDPQWEAALRKELRRLDVGRDDVVVAWPSWVEVALDVLGIEVGGPLDYPSCVSHLLRRRVWTSTLGEVQRDLAEGKIEKVFIKPTVGAKSFNGLVAEGPIDLMLNMLLDRTIFPVLGPEVEVHCRCRRLSTSCSPTHTLAPQLLLVHATVCSLHALVCSHPRSVFLATPTHPLTRSLNHPLTRSPTHQFTHS